MAGSASIPHTLDIDAEQALFDGAVQALIATCHESERPLQGLAGKLDWRFRGALAEGIRLGAMSGKPGEIAYFPIQRHDRVYHLLLIGCGAKRGKIPAEAWRALQANLASLKLGAVGVSREDFARVSDEIISKQLKGADVCIMN